MQISCIDPGQATPVSGHTAPGELYRRGDLVRHFVPAGEPVDVDPPSRALHGDVERIAVAGRAYHVATLTVAFNAWEARRRLVQGATTAYGAALQALRRSRTRVCSAAAVAAHASVFAQHEAALSEELLHRKRSAWRFRQLRARRSTVERIAERIAPMRDKRHSGNGTRRLIFYGIWTGPAVRGQAAAPNKAIIHHLAQRAPTIATSEYHTSKCCPGCGRETTDGARYRVKVCAADPDVHCPLRQEAGARAVYDRDRGGSLNIGLRGVYRVCGVRDLIQDKERRHRTGEWVDVG